MVDVDDVEQKPTLLVPESLDERRLRARRECGPSSRPATSDPQRVDPEGLNLNGLPNARRHHPVAYLRVHPGELYAAFAGGQQSRTVGPNTEPGASRVSVDDGVDRRMERTPIRRRD